METILIILIMLLIVHALRSLFARPSTTVTIIKIPEKDYQPTDGSDITAENRPVTSASSAPNVHLISPVGQEVSNFSLGW